MKIKDKVLIVEDEQSISSFISMILTANGYDTIIVNTGEEALTMISSHCPDLIVLDLGLPDMDGLEVLRSVRKWSSLPIVVVSARNHERDKVEALDYGADDYLVKPFAASRFQQALDTFCQHRETVSHDSVSQQELDALFPSSPASPSAVPPPAAPSVPKGLQARTLDRIRECLRQASRQGATCETIAERSGFSTVTVRRYLTYLVEQGEAVSHVNYDTGGRPCMLYHPLSPLSPLS